ncbi:MAG: LLM class flavin-dependent oxidoreductase [Candidatus Binatia bacterium]
MNKLQFHFFHLMPYPYFPAEREPSTWVTPSNKYYDPLQGHRIYNEYIEQLVAAERYGFDSVSVNEHHANYYGTMPSPNIIASMLVARTTNIPIGVIGNAIPLHANPLRVAEEIAMLDVISGGRIISGFVRGIGSEYFNNPIAPADSMDRFWEAHDLILKAWTEDGPFTWQGRHYYIPNCNIIPRPIQRPHPPIWIPGAGSLETLRECAEKRYTYMMVFYPQAVTKKAFDVMREEARKCGYEASKDQFNAAVPTYVAESDAQAHREAKAHLQWIFSTGLKIPEQLFFPPGYMTAQSWRNFVSTLIKYHIKPMSQMNYDELLKERMIIVGSPRTVIERYEEYCEDLGAGGMMCAGSPIGPMPNWMVTKQMQIFAEEVMPHFRLPDGKPDYMRQPRPAVHTLAEHAAVVGRPKYPARTALVGMDRPVDHRTSHLPEIIDESLRSQPVGRDGAA